MGPDLRVVRSKPQRAEQKDSHENNDDEEGLPPFGMAAW